MPEKILLVDDERLVRWSIRDRLTREGFEVDEAEGLVPAKSRMSADFYDLVILDHRLPDGSGLETLPLLVREAPETAVIMLTAYGTVEQAVRAIKSGAFDYLTKPVDMDELVAVVGRALETTASMRELRRLKEEMRQKHGPSNLIGRSPGMVGVIDMIAKVAASAATTVLLQGESGTGKDVVAKAIHYASDRSSRSFMNITCTAVPEPLLESELFGHEKGAFTDAQTAKKGLLEQAEGGTVFLDEIGDMGLALQAKMLRFLEEKSFKRVGGTRDIRVDVRVIAATNRNLAEAVREKVFREDLYYRINVIPIHLPPLRDRMEDIPVLAAHFVQHFNTEFRKNVQGFTKSALRALCAYHWPGNVRELRNVVERLMILESRDTLTVEDLPQEIRGSGRTEGPVEEPATIALPARGCVLEEVEESLLRQALERARSNRTRAARLLGITRDALRYKLKKYQLETDYPAPAGSHDS